MATLAAPSVPSTFAGPLPKSQAASTQPRAAWLGYGSIRRQILLFWLAMLLPLLAALGLAYQIQRLQAAARVVATTHEAIHHGYQLVKLFSEMQLSVHAYALTADQMFLDTYRQARASWPEAVEATGSLIAKDGIQADRLGRVERDVDQFLADWESKLPRIFPGGDDLTIWSFIDQDQLRTRRISRTIGDLVQNEEHVIAARLHDMERARSRVFIGAVASGTTAVVVFIVFATIFGRAIARPIERVAAAAHRFGSGHWNERVLPHGGEEARVLASAFNQMADSLERAHATVDARNREIERTSVRLATANEDLLERQRETDDFLYVLSHDLRAPLINIQGFSKRLQTNMTALAERLAEVAPADEPRTLLGRMSESLKFVNAGAGKIDQLIARLLEIARLTTRRNPHQWIDTQALVRDVIEACRFQLEERGITVSVGTLPQVFADPVQLNQVFTNLVDNAIKYMGERLRKRIAITCTEQGDRHCFAVADTGPGIAPKDQDKVFRMFSRLAGNAIPGEGIGLAAVRTIVNRHGGRIWVESALDEGSSFFFTLPHTPSDSRPLATTIAATGKET